MCHFYFDSQGFEDCLVFDEIMDQLNENLGKTETQENSSSQYFWDERKLLIKLHFFIENKKYINVF